MPTTELELEVAHELWRYGEVRKAVGNNFIVLRATVHNIIKNLGTIDLGAFRDGFDIHELDTTSQDTLADSLTRVLRKYAKAGGDVGNALDEAPYLITNRLREVLEHLRSSGGSDSDALEYAKALVEQLRSFNTLLASIYEGLLTPNQTTPANEELPKPATRGRVKLFRLYRRLRAMRTMRRPRKGRAAEQLVPITEYLRSAPQA
jgi:hypothetical protein